MNETRESAGARLRRERERQGLTMQKVADDLRLDRVVVEALEDDSYVHTVPPVYAKGHLRKYYQLLGLSLDEGPAAEPPGGSAAAPAPAARSMPTSRQSTRAMRIAPHVRKLPWTKISIAAVIILILLLFWWSPWKHRVAVQASTAQPVASSTVEDNPVPSAASAPAADMAAAPAAEPSPPVPAPIRPAPTTSAVAAPAALPAAGDGPTDVTSAGHINLRLAFSETAWIDVRDASGQRLFVGYGRADTVRTVAGRAPLRVRFGPARGVRVAINEHEVPIGPALIKGKVALFLAGADGVLRPVAGNPRTRN
jgi:cytoskeleton protein RodZ